MRKSAHRRGKMGLNAWIVLGCLLCGSLSYGNLADRAFLVGGSARLLGLGSADVAGPGESTSLFWNPGSLGLLHANEFSFTDRPLQAHASDRESFLALTLSPAQFGFPSERIALGANGWFDGWGDDPEKNRVLRTGLGLRLGHGFSVGAGLVHERRNTRQGTEVGWGVDLGALWNVQLPRFGDRLQAGIAVQRLMGRRDWFNGASDPTPLRLRGGIGFQPESQTWFVADLVYTHDETLTSAERLRAHLGVERWFLGRLGVRIGYTGIAHYDLFTEGTWSRGLSLRTDTGQIDYAYVSGGELEEATHWITATLRWQWPTPPAATQVSESYHGHPEKPATLQADLRAIPASFSPNGDGKRDVLQFEVKLSSQRPWQIHIEDVDGKQIRVLPPAIESWDGLDEQGHTVPEGDYRALLVLEDEPTEPLAEAIIHVDLTPPQVRIAADALILVERPTKGLVAVEAPQIHVSTQDPGGIQRWMITIMDPERRPLTQREGKGAPPSEVLWDDWDESLTASMVGQQLPCIIEVTDQAGNLTQATTELPVVNFEPKVAASPQTEVRSPVEEENRDDWNMTLSGVAFDTNSTTLQPAAYVALERIAEAIRRHPEAKVRIEGHTDDRGTEEYNQRLSLARANAVKDYLVETFGFDPKRFTTVGYGESRPIADNATEAGRRKNRRVEIILLAPESEEAVRLEPQVEEPRSSEKPKDARYTVSVGTFRNETNAQTLLETVRKLELPYEIRLLKIPGERGTLYRVTVGAFRDETSAEKTADLLETEHGFLPIVIPYE